jgi:hypothetical protein
VKTKAKSTTCNSKCLLLPCSEDQFTTSSTTSPVFANCAILSADDFVEVQINYEAIRYDLITESKAQSLTRLLGSIIGGQMGLFVGISLIFDLRNCCRTHDVSDRDPAYGETDVCLVLEER